MEVSRLLIRDSASKTLKHEHSLILKLSSHDRHLLRVNPQYFECEDEFDGFSKPGVEEGINQRVKTRVQHHDPS